ncbi:MAG: outer membrane beta-barrel protein [Odoribacteraceae bacterium]|jgi:hypothetical protein|nr:outer membrane beta-barrel protein [Odoribacteraceae bacterium]
MSDALEELFRTTLEKVAVTPPERVWSRVDAHFSARRRLRRLAYSGAAAAVALMAALPLFFSPAPRDAPALLAARILPGSPVLVSPAPPAPSLPSPPPPSRRQVAVVPNDPIDPVALSPGRLPAALSSNDPAAPALAPMTSRNTIPLVNGAAVANALKYHQLLASGTAAPARKEVRRTEPRYTVSGYVSPGYSSGKYKATGGTTNDQMSGIYNINGGVAFAVNTGKRLAVETGVGFSRVGQAADIKYHTPMSLSPAARNVITPLGNVNNSSKVLAVLHNSNEEILEGVRSYQTGALEQRFDAIDIPLYLRYYINNTKLKFSVIGGLGTHLLVDNRTYLTSSDSRDNLGATDDIRKLNFSARLGLGLEYPITRVLHFKFEPAFKYYLQSISNNSNIDFRPYSLNLSTGFGIRF